MKKPVRPMTESELLRDFPDKGKTTGWYFRIRESSANVYEVEGTDGMGRRVYRQDTRDPDELLEECEAEAAEINRTLGRS